MVPVLLDMGPPPVCTPRVSPPLAVRLSEPNEILELLVSDRAELPTSIELAKVIGPALKANVLNAGLVNIVSGVPVPVSTFILLLTVLSVTADDSERLIAPVLLRDPAPATCGTISVPKAPAIVMPPFATTA